MMLRYVIPLIAFLGLAGAILFTFTMGKAEEQKPNQIAQPPATPYAQTVSGTGIIEANTRNIEVGSFLSGIVTKMFVTEGQLVNTGDPLFQVDERAASAELMQRNKELAAAQARLEDSRVALADQQDQLKRAEGMKVGIAISDDRLTRLRFAAKRGNSAVSTASAELESAKAQADVARVTLERLTVRSPAAGKILKVRIQPGEFVTPGQGESPILFGNDTPLYLRVTIDENDVWRYTPESKAMAVLRSNKDITVPLKFVRIEPYVQPKRNLSGDLSERVDTRVLEVVYEIEPNKVPLYIGQQMDVFIEAGTI